jgi:hypothetical protein
MKNGKQRITWKSYKVAIKDIKPTPNNFKIKTALGAERLKHTLRNFGLAGTVICNWNGRLGDIRNVMLIDGNSRVEQEREAGTTIIEVSLPDRVLSPQQYKEFSAMIDFAKAGEVDMDRIEKEIGTTKNFYENYHLEPPTELLNKLGANAPRVKISETETQATVTKVDERAVTLYFTEADEMKFRAMEERLKIKLKTTTTSATVFKAFKKLL